MNDQQENLTANHQARPSGCRIKSEDRNAHLKAMPDKHKLTLVALVETEKVIRLPLAADAELRQLIGAVQKRRINLAQDGDLPPAA